MYKCSLKKIGIISQTTIYVLLSNLPEGSVPNGKFVASHPSVSVRFQPLHPVASDGTTTILLWLIPGESQGVLGNVRGLELSGGPRSVWNKIGHTQVNTKNTFLKQTYDFLSLIIYVMSFLILARGPTKGISSDDWSMFSCCTNSKLILCKHPENILLKGHQVDGLVGGLFDSGRKLVPDLAVCSSPLHNVVGDLRAPVISGRVPCKEAGLIGDLRNVKGSRRTWLIC